MTSHHERFTGLGSWPGVLGHILAGESLDAEAAEAVLSEVLDGEAAPAQVAALLVALRARGETES
jgi:anthranilate phosphoribosyltransferase